MKNLQGGTLLFGPDDSEWDELDEIEGLAKFTYTFFSPFSTVPHIIATARHPANTNFSDVFSVTIQSVSTTSVTFLVKRVDSEGGWGMNLHVDWWGFEL